MSGATDETDREDLTVRGGMRKRMTLRGILPADSNSYVIDGARMTLGRGDTCDIRLQTSRVSREHAELYRQGPLLAIRDLGSTNGTWVDGKRAPHIAIRHGTLVRLGDWLGIFEELEKPEPLASFAELAPGVFGGAALAATLAAPLQVATSDLPIVLVGPTGSGKERFASAIHEKSGRRGPFRALNCAALPAGLAEAELFGFRKGAFTGADRSQIGHLRAADEGTLFLDEIAELSLEAQPKLLRALERAELTPLGETKPVPFNARIVVASQAPLAELVKAGVFRADLANRLSGLTVDIPALAARRADIPGLFNHFLTLHSGDRAPEVCTRLYERLCLHGWPGNARELELLARRLLAQYGSEGRLARTHLPGHLLDLESQDDTETIAPSDQNRSDYERKQLDAALRQCAGNIKAAAAKVGISRQRAYRLMGSDARRSRIARG